MGGGETARDAVSVGDGLSRSGDLDVYKTRFGDILMIAASADGRLGETAVREYPKV